MEKVRITSFEEAESYLNQLPVMTAKHTMEETKAYLHKLGDPDRRMHIIHVAGTNGKGSVCAYLRYILEAMGKQVAVFTSPHLVDIRERFLIKGQMPSKETFLQAFLQIYDSLDWEALAAGDGYHPTYFEYLFFIAMILFDREDLDYCILETGLGGRLDATNAVAKKELCVITHISLDHVALLGHTIAAIAREKAGIMQAGCRAVYWENSEGKRRKEVHPAEYASAKGHCVGEAASVIFDRAMEDALSVDENSVEKDSSAIFRERAQNLEIEAFPVSKNDYLNLKINPKSIDFLYKSRYDKKGIPLRIHTKALYQVENATLAARAAEVLFEKEVVLASALQEGIAKCFWAGRMEEVLPEVYVDGAHNEDGIRAFLDSVALDGWQGERILLCSVVSDKEYDKMFEKVTASGLFSHLAVAGMHSARGLSMTKLEEMLEQYLPGQKLPWQEEILLAEPEQPKQKKVLQEEPEQPKQKKVLQEEAEQPKQRKVLQEEPEQHKESHKGCTYTMYTSVAEGLKAVLAEQRSRLSGKSGSRNFKNRVDEKECGCQKAAPAVRIYAAGSLYLVGEIKELLSHDKF